MNPRSSTSGEKPFIAYRTDAAPSGGPSGPAPYSQIVRVRDFLFVTAQSPIDPITKTLIGNDVASQTAAALENLRTVLAAAKAEMDDVFKTTVYLHSLSQIAGMNDAYGKAFNEPYPARTILPFSELPFGALVYIEAVAIAREHSGVS